MGMTIEDIIQGLRETYVICRSVYAYDRKKYIDGAIDRLNKYQMMKADYENRIKADLKAILVELQLEIEELRLDRPLFSRGYECYGLEDKTPTEIQQECSDIIQQKINELKEDQEGKNEISILKRT